MPIISVLSLLMLLFIPTWLFIILEIMFTLALFIFLITNFNITAGLEGLVIMAVICIVLEFFRFLIGHLHFS